MGNDNIIVIFWVDVFNFVIYVEIVSFKKILLSVLYENWRYEDYIICIGE